VLAGASGAAFERQSVEGPRQGDPAVPIEWEKTMAKDENDPAKLAIIREWDAWALKNPDDAKTSDGMLFFSYLQKERPDLLLDFKYSGDQWQIIHAWLLRARKVKH
jgi:hypothetical protein